jgi:hypothetical protein
MDSIHALETRRRILKLLALIVGLRPSLLPAQEPAFPEKIGKDIFIKQVNPHPPVIDGKLNDATWQNAARFSDFVQQDPIENIAPSESIVVYLCYDPSNLYVGVRAFDSESDKIVGRLGRRDQFNDSDWLWFSIDSRHDHQTGFGFAINAAGVEVDMVHYDDVDDDLSWDGVWDSGTSIDDQGWCAEFRIPLSMLRFSAEEEQTWGFQFGRTIVRKKENDWWVLRPRGASGYVSRFGHLHGLRGLQAPRKLEVLPYSVGRTDVLRTEGVAGEKYRVDAGFDLKYGVTAGSTLEATFNPDFGQVEADPAVLNLTVYETFFPERRPFFIEGANFFKTPFQLFHSRRIGREPGRLGSVEDDGQIEAPKATTIAGAGKWIGKSPHGLAYGALLAATTREYAKVLDAAGKPQSRLIEPAAGYGVLRVTQDFGNGNSYLGGLVTAVRRGSGDADAYTGGVDWKWRLHQNIYQFSGQVIGSQVREAATTTGWGAQWDIRKRGGRNFHWNFTGSAVKEKLNFNDLGFMRRNDLLELAARAAYLLPDPNKITRSAEYAIEVSRASRFNDGLQLNTTYSFTASQQFLNYYWLGFVADFSAESFDDLDARGGPPIIKPRSDLLWIWIGSDSRKAVNFSISAYRGSNAAGNRSHTYNLVLDLKPSDNLKFSLQPGYKFTKNVAQWVDTLDVNNDKAIDHYLYASLRSKIVDLTMRADLTLHRNLSVQFYMQPFIATGAYENFKVLARPKSFDFTPYAYSANRDFNFKSLNSNLVVRWEYRPGSTVFVGWQQRRFNFDHPGKLKVFRDLKDLFGAAGDHIFLIKANFWINL